MVVGFITLMCMTHADVYFKFTAEERRKVVTFAYEVPIFFTTLVYLLFYTILVGMNRKISKFFFVLSGNYNLKNSKFH